MKILVIDKTAVLNSSHERYERIASHPEVELCVFSPTTWYEHMRQVPAERTSHPAYRIKLGKPFWNGSYSRGFYLTGLKKCIRDFQPDIIQLLEEPWSFFAGQTVRYARKHAPGCRLFFYTWENLYREGTYCSKLDPIHRRIEADVFDFAAGGICATETARKVLVRKGFGKPSPVIPYGIPSRFIAAEEEIERRQHRPLSDPPRIGYIGRILAMKGIDTLIRSLANLEGELILLGDGEEESKLKKVAEEVGVEARTTWISAVPPDQVIDHLKSLDVLVLPSRTTETWAEQLGRVMLEAMGCGVPVVGSSSGSIPEVIGETGWVFEEGNPEDLTEKLQSVLNEPGLRSQRIRAGWEKVRERYTWRTFSDDLIHHYTETLNAL